jgi:hypothetical protein
VDGSGRGDQAFNSSGILERGGERKKKENVRNSVKIKLLKVFYPE